MAANWAGLQSALESAIAATWPAVKPGSGGAGILNADRTQRMDFDKVHAGSGSLKYPYAVIELTGGQPAEGAPITAKIYAVLVTLHYITRVEEGGSVAGEATVRARLEAMEDALLATGLGTSYPVLAVEAITLPDDHDLTAAFIAANLPWIAGSVTARVWVGES